MNATVHESTLAIAHESAATVSAETLFRAYASFVAVFLQRLGAAPDEIEDLVQDVFVVVHCRGGFVPGAAHPKTWLAEIGLRRFSSLRRTSMRRRTSPAPGEFFAAVPASAASPFDAASSAQGLRRVQQAIDAMDLDQRTVFLLFEIEGDSCDSIAAAMRIPVGTVYSRLHAARQSFRKAHARLDREPHSGARGHDPVRLRDDPSLPQDQRQELARFAVAAYPAFDVPHAIARFRVSTQSLPSAPPHVFASGAGAHPCAIAISLAAHLALGFSAAAWMKHLPPVARAEIEPIALSVEDDSNDSAARGDGRDRSSSFGNASEKGSRRPAVTGASARGRALAAGRVRDDQPRETTGTKRARSEPSLKWTLSLPSDMAELSIGDSADGEDEARAGAEGAAGVERSDGRRGPGPSPGAGFRSGKERGPGVSVGTGFEEDDQGRAAHLLPAWDCEYPSWAKVGALVQMVVTVRPDGTAAAAEITSDPGHGFAGVARECAMRQRFLPARDEHGRPIFGKTGPFNVRFIR